MLLADVVDRRRWIATPFMVLDALHDALVKPMPGNAMASAWPNWRCPRFAVAEVGLGSITGWVFSAPTRT